MLMEMARARRRILEVKKLINEQKTHIRDLIREKQACIRKPVDQVRHQEHSIDGLSQEFEQLSTTTEVDSDEEWLVNREEMEACLGFLDEDL